MRKTVAAAAVILVAIPYPAPAQQSSSTHGYHVTGRVVMGDGSAIPDNAVVELICSGRLRKRTRPYTNGDFVVQLEDDGMEAADITAPRDHTGGRSAAYGAVGSSANATMTRPGEDTGRFDLSSCELRASLPGYTSNIISVGPRRRLDKPVVGQLVLHRNFAPDNPVFTPNTLAAPPDARKSLDAAWTILQRDKPDHKRAVRELERALKLYPAFAAAWHLLGATRLQMTDEVGAREAFNRSIAADETYVEPYIELASLEAQKERWAETAKLVERVHDINPNIAYAHYLSACAHFHLGNADIAEESAMDIVDTPDIARFPLVYYILGAIQAQRGDFATAAARFRQFLDTKPSAAVVGPVEEMLSDWAREGRIKSTP